MSVVTVLQLVCLMLIGATYAKPIGWVVLGLAFLCLMLHVFGVGNFAALR